MDVSRILSEIDAEIARLQQARGALTALTGTGTVASAPRRGRPPKNSANTETKTAPGTRRKRNLTPEGRKRIADAMKRRWAERRGSSAEK